MNLNDQECRIGVIVPAYNCGSYLSATLASIAAQTHRNIECIVVNDGSTDDTAAVGEAFARSDAGFIVINQNNTGVAGARNRGLAELSNDVHFITCMDADDIYLPDALKTLLNELFRSPEAVAAHGLAGFIDEAGKPMAEGEFENLGRSRQICSEGRVVLLPLDRPTTFASILTTSTVFPPGLMLSRRDVTEKVGPYDKTIVPADDWDYVVRLTRHGPISFVNQKIVLYRRHQNNQGASSIVPEMCRRVNHKAFFSPENTAEHRRIAKQIWRTKNRELIRFRISEASKSARLGRIDRAVAKLLRIPFIAYRCLRGYPTLGWL